MSLAARTRPSVATLGLPASFWAVTLLAAVVHATEGGTLETETPSAEKAGDEGTDETKQLLSKLTIAMTSEVIDERTVLIRDAARASKKGVHLRLGNVGSTPRGSLEDGEYTEKVGVAKGALAKLVEKQMVWYKAAPDTVQPPNSTDDSPDIVIADIWTTEGKHVNTHLKKEGHLAEAQDYDHELNKDILSAAAEVEKKESYKQLEEALKESEKAKKEAAKAAKAKAEQEEAEANVEGIGFGGWIGLALVAFLVIGILTNFGRPSGKKVNLNRKKGPLERFWTKLKGQ